MKHLGLVLVLAIAGTASANTYSDNDKTVTHDCAKDPEVTVGGHHNTITFTGTCTRIAAAGNRNKLTVASVKRLDVPGNENTVIADEADAISVLGNRNTVTWSKGITTKTPKVTSLGKNNKVAAAK
jgi:hypothetical protein